jgi:uncharacterized protein YbaP (TraB family)
MYLWTIEYNNIKSYLIPSFHFNINLIFSEDEIKKFEDIIQNSDIVLLESDVAKKKTLSKTEKKTKLRSQIKKIYTHSDIDKIVKKLNTVFNIELEPKDIEKKDIMGLTPGPGIGGLTCDMKNMMDHKLYDIAKDKKKHISFLDHGKTEEKALSNMSNMISKTREHFIKNPFTIKNISKHISMTKKTTNSYKKIFKNTNNMKITKKNSDKTVLENRNFIWAHKIANLIHKNKSVMVIGGAAHFDLSFNNNVIDLLKKKYNINAYHTKI